MNSKRWAILLAGAFSTAGVMGACGSRTPLPYPEEITGTVGESDGATGRRDGAAPGEDATVLPPIDATPPVDANRDDCPDASATLVYLITTQGELLSFFPPTSTFRRIGIIACPSPPSTTPFSMAVDRQGAAYVLFNDGNLYRVSTATAACIATPYSVGQHGFNTFGMGYATDLGGPSETLYVAAEGNLRPSALGSIETQSFVLSVIGNFAPPIRSAELTGTGDGRLFAFYSDTNRRDSWIGLIDKSSAQVTAADKLSGLEQGQGWAFAYWGGDFWLFTAPGGQSRVHRFRPQDKSLVEISRYGGMIVGAGVSTCAPQ